MYDLREKTVFLTGASGNLGRSAALAFANQGARIALIGRDLVKLQQVRQELPASTDATCFFTDLLDPLTIVDLVEQVITHFGSINIVANLAGGFRMGPYLHETSERDWNAMLDLNVRTIIYCVRAVVPKLIAAGNGGRIINIAAHAALHGRARMAPYCIAKSAVITLTESLADELKPWGITVNCLVPDTLDTQQNRAAMPEQDPKAWVKLDALADIMVFLASDSSRALTGAAIPVHG